MTGFVGKLLGFDKELERVRKVAIEDGRREAFSDAERRLQEALKEARKKAVEEGVQSEQKKAAERWDSRPVVQIKVTQTKAGKWQWTARTVDGDKFVCTSGPGRYATKEEAMSAAHLLQDSRLRISH